MKLKKLTTTETRRAVTAAVERAIQTRGPQLADLREVTLPGGLTPFTYCLKYALTDEWAALQKAVAARVAREPKAVWWKCDKCGRVTDRPFRAAPLGACVSCNAPGYEDGGQMREMKPAEVKAYQADEAVRKAEAVKRDAAAALWAENQERGAAGVRPLTLAEFNARQKAAGQRRTEDARRMAARTTKGA